MDSLLHIRNQGTIGAMSLTFLPERWWLPFFWDAGGAIHINYLEKGKTSTSIYRAIQRRYKEKTITFGEENCVWALAVNVYYRHFVVCAANIWRFQQFAQEKNEIYCCVVGKVRWWSFARKGLVALFKHNATTIILPQFPRSKNHCTLNYQIAVILLSSL